MKHILLALTCLLLLGGASPTPTEQRLTIAHVEDGIVYWNGHRLTPPYEIAVVFRWTESDTVLENIYINDLPVIRGEKPIPDRQLTNAEVDTIAHKQALFARAAEVEGAARSRGANDLEQAQAWAEVVRRDEAYVDSVFLNPVQTPPFTRFVYWRGRSDPLPVGVSTQGGLAGPRLPLLRALRIADGLQRGDLILVGQGTMRVPRSRVKAVLAEIEAIKQGGSRRTRFIKDPEMEKALRQPRPIRDLLEGGQ